MGIPNQRKRSPEKSRELNRKWNDVSTIQHDLSGIRPIYAPRDLYDACKSAVEESHASQNSESFLVPSGEMPARVHLQTFQARVYIIIRKLNGFLVYNGLVGRLYTTKI